MRYKFVFTLALIFGIIPALLLYRFIYGILHESAVYLECRRLISCSNYYEGISLKLISLVYLIFYMIIVVYLPYQVARKRDISFFSLQALKSIDSKGVLIVILVSLLYLPLVFLLSSSNPW